MGPIRLLDELLLFLLASITVLVLCMIAARLRREAREQRNARFRKRWEPVLHGRISGEHGPLAALSRRERLPFLMLWLHLLGYVREEAADALVRAGQEMG